MYRFDFDYSRTGNDLEFPVDMDFIWIKGKMQGTEWTMKSISWSIQHSLGILSITGL